MLGSFSNWEWVDLDKKLQKKYLGEMTPGVGVSLYMNTKIVLSTWLSSLYPRMV